MDFWHQRTDVSRIETARVGTTFGRSLAEVLGRLPFAKRFPDRPAPRQAAGGGSIGPNALTEMGNT